MEISLSGRAAIVTGGSKGIGLAVATRFAASGADVAIVARTEESLKEAVSAIQRTTRTSVIGVQADVSKAAGMAMTKALSHELAPHNVLVNAMLVDLIRADQHVQSAKRANMPIEAYYEAHQKEIPIGRFGEAEEFANLACFLVSEQGGYITGTAINVDGGRSPVV